MILIVSHLSITEYGLGGFASEDLKEGCIFGSIPTSLVLTESFILSLPLSEAVSEALEGFTYTTEEVKMYTFCLFLMLERADYHAEDGEGVADRRSISWGPYARSLPSHYTDPLW